VEDRKVSANTHLDKWWFKTFETITAIVAYSMNINMTSFLNEAGLFFAIF